jgi:CheY-like chemotaxis protein
MLAERSAREATEAKDTFIAILSHELRSPLAPVLAAASALKGGQIAPAELARLCELIQRNVSLQARLIDDLLDATRIVRGKMQVHCEPLDLHPLVCEVVEMFRDELRSKQLELVLALDAKRETVEGDPVRLRQVVWNLLKNAIKFTRAGGRIAVRSWNDHQRVALEVSDSGIGLRPEAIERLFQPFEQNEGGAAGGLGLGLAIARGVVELHNGRITATSPGENKGSRFVVDLPLVVGANAGATAAVEHEPVRAGPALVKSEDQQATKARILLLEDNRDMAEALSLSLRSRGYEVKVAHSIRAALKTDFSTVDLVISDIGLPDGGGLTFVRKLHQKVNVRAIALSGYGTERDVQASQEAGFLMHLTKPVDLATLVAAIEEAMKVAAIPPARRPPPRLVGQHATGGRR